MFDIQARALLLVNITRVQSALINTFIFDRKLILLVNVNMFKTKCLTVCVEDRLWCL